MLIDLSICIPYNSYWSVSQYEEGLGGYMSIRKAVLPVAGLGTRVLPASKVIAKEMLPIVDKPTLQYIVEEAVSAGIEDVILINGRGKGCIEDHFDLAVELEAVLKARGKMEEFKKLRAVAELANMVSVRTKETPG